MSPAVYHEFRLKLFVYWKDGKQRLEIIIAKKFGKKSREIKTHYLALSAIFWLRSAIISSCPICISLRSGLKIESQQAN